MLSAFNVPNTLSVHISLGFLYKPATLITPLTLYGFS
nr:MAG TPA: hypothetical protein [Caudoviricetes sp.]